MKRQLEADIVEAVPSCGHSDNRALTGIAKEWTFLLPFKRWCIHNGIPEELLTLIVARLLDRIRERSVIERMKQARYDAFRISAKRDIFYENYGYSRDLVAMDKRLHQILSGGGYNGVEHPRYMGILDKMIEENVVQMDDILHVFQEGINNKDMYAWNLISKHKIGGRMVQSVQRMRTFIIQTGLNV